jgi:hypothetical protein
MSYSGKTLSIFSSEVGIFLDARYERMLIVIPKTLNITIFHDPGKPRLGINTTRIPKVIKSE